ncbi:Protein mahjong, partial [Pseudolycoriella hygida]
MTDLCKNISFRYTCRQNGTDTETRWKDRLYVHSEFGLDRVIRPYQGDAFFTCCDFTHCTTRLIVGLKCGSVKMYSTKNRRLYTTQQCHGNFVTNLKTSKDGRLLLTSNFSSRPLSRLWNIKQKQLTLTTNFNDDQYLEFGKLNEDKIIGTSRSTATIYDVQTGQSICSFVPSMGNYCRDYRATFNPFDNLILSEIIYGMIPTMMTKSGIVAVYNNKNGSLYTTHQCHGSSVTHVKTSMDRNLLLTCSSYRRPLSRMWNIENNQLSVQLDFAEDEYLEFSKLNEDKIIGTSRSTATIYDVQTGQSIATFVPSIGNVYKEYRATFNPSDELILSGGLLWDVRSGRVLHQFELLSQKLPGVFHPNGLEIVSNSSVWDIRTFRLLRTVPQLELSIVKFSPQHVIYVIPSEVSRMISVIENGDCLEDTFKVLNSSDYSTIVTVNVGRNIYDLSVNRYGTQVASVENVGNFYWNFKSTIYQINKNKSGIVAVYNNKNGSLYTTHQCHGSSVTHVKTSKDGRLLLTCSSYRRPLSRMWNIARNKLSEQLDFAEDQHLEFSKLNEDKIIGTSRSTATIYDVQTGQSTATFAPSNGNVYKENRATFNPSDELILSVQLDFAEDEYLEFSKLNEDKIIGTSRSTATIYDVQTGQLTATFVRGILWDVRSGRELHQFELLSQKLPSVFHPNGLEIVSNSSVWDIRTFRLLRTVPQLELSIVKFSPQHVIYVIPSEISRIISVVENVDCLEDTFKVLNSSDYSTIVTVNVGRNIYDFSVNRYGTQVALVENAGNFYWNFRSTVHGVLWDARAGREIHTFSMFEDALSGVFHPNGCEIVANHYVWDIRTFGLVRTIPELELLAVTFSSQNVIYAIPNEYERLNGFTEEPLHTSFLVMDMYDYSLIERVKVGHRIFDISVNKHGSQVALVENTGKYDDFSSNARIYEVGKRFVNNHIRCRNYLHHLSSNDDAKSTYIPNKQDDNNDEVEMMTTNSNYFHSDFNF